MPSPSSSGNGRGADRRASRRCRSIRRSPSRSISRDRRADRGAALLVETALRAPRRRGLADAPAARTERRAIESRRVRSPRGIGLSFRGARGVASLASTERRPPWPASQRRRPDPAHAHPRRVALGPELGEVRRLLRQRGFAVSAPEWPRKHGDVEELREEADEIAGPRPDRDRRPLRGADPRAGRAAGADRALVRRPDRRAAARPRPRPRRRGAEPGAAEGHPRAAVLVAQGGVAGARPPVQAPRDRAR